MQTIEQRVREHAIIAGILADGGLMNSHAAEGDAWVADICARAMEAGADLRAVAADISETMRDAGAFASEQVFAQLVVAEIEALAHRAPEGQSARALSHAIRAKFASTEGPQPGGGLSYVLHIRNAEGLSTFERDQAKAIYATAMLKHFGNASRAFRAWAARDEMPSRTASSQWRRHHPRAQLLAFAGQDVGKTAGVRVCFKVHP